MQPNLPFIHLISTRILNFYDGKGQLQDILYDRQNCRKGDRINLTFKHLFACITFHVAAGINQTLQNITFRPSVLITGLNHRTGALSMETTENPQSVTLNKAEDGNYSLIIPPSEHLKIDICIQTTDGKSYETSMPESHFAAGTSYSCRILSNADTQGFIRLQISSPLPISSTERLTKDVVWMNSGPKKTEETSTGCVQTLNLLRKNAVS